MCNLVNNIFNLTYKMKLKHFLFAALFFVAGMANAQQFGSIPMNKNVRQTQQWADLLHLAQQLARTRSKLLYCTACGLYSGRRTTTWLGSLP